MRPGTGGPRAGGGSEPRKKGRVGNVPAWCHTEGRMFHWASWDSAWAALGELGGLVRAGHGGAVCLPPAAPCSPPPQKPSVEQHQGPGAVRAPHPQGVLGSMAPIPKSLPAHGTGPAPSSKRGCPIPSQPPHPSGNNLNGRGSWAASTALGLSPSRIGQGETRAGHRDTGLGGVRLPPALV